MFDGSIYVADVCAGSGAIGLSLNRLLPNNRYYLSDMSKEAIRVSKKNSKNASNIVLLEGDMLEPFIERNIKLDVIVCNPPYIGSPDSIDKRTLEQEPHLALLASPNTKYYESLLKNANKVLKDKHLIAFEIGEDMKESLKKLVKEY